VKDEESWTDTAHDTGKHNASDVYLGGEGIKTSKTVLIKVDYKPDTRAHIPFNSAKENTDCILGPSQWHHKATRMTTTSHYCHKSKHTTVIK